MITFSFYQMRHGLGNALSMLKFFEKLSGLRINVLEGYASLTELVIQDWYLMCMGCLSESIYPLQTLCTVWLNKCLSICMGGKAYLFIYLFSCSGQDNSF